MSYGADDSYKICYQEGVVQAYKLSYQELLVGIKGGKEENMLDLMGEYDKTEISWWPWLPRYRAF
jgi:hypothetical protein